jgi:hypothetical protein
LLRGSSLQNQRSAFPANGSRTALCPTPAAQAAELAKKIPIFSEVFRQHFMAVGLDGLVHEQQRERTAS